jgi:hypothetical protein
MRTRPAPALNPTRVRRRARRQLQTSRLECDKRVREAHALAAAERAAAAAAAERCRAAEAQRAALVRQVAAMRAEAGRRETEALFGPLQSGCGGGDAAAAAAAAAAADDCADRGTVRGQMLALRSQVRRPGTDSRRL